MEGPLRQRGSAKDVREPESPAAGPSAARAENLAAFFDAALDLHCIASLDGRFLELSAEWAQTLGYELQELLGRPFLDLVHPDDRERTLQALRALQGGEKVLDFENRYRCKDGTWRWIEWRSLARGEIVLASARDVTERKRLQQELLDSREQLRQTSHLLQSVLDSIPDVIGIQDTKHEIICYNKAGYAFLGLAAEDAVGRRCFELIGQASPCEQCASTEAIRTGKPARVLKHLSDTSIWLDCRSYPVFDDTGRLQCLVEHLRDISDLKHAEGKLRATEQRLAHAQKMEAVGHLAGGIAHDFNNQLCGVMGYADLLHASLAEMPDKQQLATAIVTAAHRAAQLTRQLLAFARQGKSQDLEVDLHATIAEVTGILEHSIDKRIAIERALEASPATTRGDPTQIQSVLLNLALNARDAMPEGGLLAFRTRNVQLAEEAWDLGPFDTAPGAFVCVSVSDSGTGMTPEVLRRIFEPFFTTKPEGKGTGMGLAAVHGTMGQHNGAIRVSSTPGAGSTFELFFPLRRGAPVHDNGAKVHAPQARQCHVLVVDDDAIVRRVVREMLAGAGYTVSECESAREAVALYREAWRDFDLVVLDMIMPDMNGEATLAALREINPGVAVLLSSGHCNEALTQSLVERTGARFLQKPFRIHELLREVEATLQRAVTR
jgi:PAS domain S-box-containing protein